MTRATILGLLALAPGCLGIFGGGQSGSEVTSFGDCHEVRRSRHDDRATPADGLDFAIDDVLDVYERLWSDGEAFELEIALDEGRTAVVELEDDNDKPCPPAYAVPLRIHVAQDTLVQADLAFEQLVDDVDRLVLSTHTDTWSGSAEPPDDAQVLWLSGQLTLNGGSGSLTWSDGTPVVAWIVLP